MHNRGFYEESAQRRCTICNGRGYWYEAPPYETKPIESTEIEPQYFDEEEEIKYCDCSAGRQLAQRRKAYGK